VKALIYTGNLLITDDDIAEAALEYAETLAQNHRIARISIPVLVDGSAAKADLIIGQGIALAMLPAPQGFERLGDGADAVAALKESTASIVAPVQRGNPYVSSAIDDLNWFG